MTVSGIQSGKILNMTWRWTDQPMTSLISICLGLSLAHLPEGKKLAPYETYHGVEVVVKGVYTDKSIDY